MKQKHKGAQRQRMDPAKEGPAGPVLEVRGLRVGLRAKSPTLVEPVDFELAEGETLGVVGESGSGKSVTMLALMGLLPKSALEVSGEVILLGRDVQSMTRRELRAIRGTAVGMIFQDPMTSLDPVFTLGHQIGEAIRVHDRRASREKAWERAVELLRVVGVSNPEGRASQFPHEFSGGMRQRAMIAMAIANRPAVLIADEPTTALDVTIQAQVMEVLREAQHAVGAGVILISHDLGLIAESTDRVMVMYAGQVVEVGGTSDVIGAPRHPYTASLLACLPAIDGRRDRLATIPGEPPAPGTRTDGCRFVDRCPLSQGRLICREVPPELVDLGKGRLSACHFSEELQEARS